MFLSFPNNPSSGPFVLFMHSIFLPLPSLREIGLQLVVQRIAVVDELREHGKRWVGAVQVRMGVRVTVRSEEC